MVEPIVNVIDVTIVPSDGLCIINGEQVSDKELFNTNDFPFHALQYHNETLVLEPSMSEANIIKYGEDGYNYNNYIVNALTKFNNKREQEEAERVVQEAEYQAYYNSTEQRAVRVRTERDKRLNDTQWLVSRHQEEVSNGLETTLSEEQFNELLEYRQALRDLPTVEGFPWQGGDNNEIPWPVRPSFVVIS